MGRAPFRRDVPGYAYYRASDARQELSRVGEAIALSQELLNPKLRNPNFLVLRERRRLFAQFVQELPERKLTVLDVGGRLQPYRSLLEDRLDLYVAIDPVLEGLLDAVAVGEAIPFRDECFDLVVCTQVLTYVAEPRGVMSEVHRVLKTGGHFFLSVPAIFPRYHDIRWCFMPEGVATLLSSFSESKIIPEDNSIAGLFRTINLFVDTYIRSQRVKRLVAYTVFPVMNLTGLVLDRFSRGRTEFSTNYSCIARK